MSLPTTGWYGYWERVRHAWGSAGHGCCICGAGLTTLVTQDSLGLKLPPLAYKGKQINKWEQINPKFYPNFFRPTFKSLFPFLSWSPCPSPYCPVGIVSFLAAQYYCSLFY